MPQEPLCILPWIHIFIGTTGWVQLCCVSGSGEDKAPVYGTIREHSVLELFNSEHMKKIRKQMLDGKWPSECNFCQRKESLGLHSFREYYNEKYSEYYDQLKHNPKALEPKIRTIDIRISNICNHKCRSCSGYASTQWFKEHNAIYPDKKRQKQLDGIHDINYFWQDFEEHIIHDLEEIHFAGGEPLIMEEHYRILEKLLLLDKNNVELYYDTNLSVLKFKHWDVIKLWKQFQNIRLSLSLDGVEKQGEYIRSGLVYNRWVCNVRRVMEETPHVQRVMHFVVSIFNILDLKYHYDTIIQNGFVDKKNIGFTFLEWPSYLNVQTMPLVLKKLVEQRLIKMIKNDELLEAQGKHNLRSLISFMYKRNMYPIHGEEFVRKTKQLDELRNENVLTLFPELAIMILGYVPETFN